MLGQEVYWEHPPRCKGWEEVEGLIGLGGREVVRFGEGVVGKGEFRRWGERLVKALSGAGDDVVVENGGGGHEGELEADDGFENEEEEDGVVEEIVDLEDIARKGPRKGKDTGVANGVKNGEREMVMPVIRASLEKQVDLIGTRCCCNFCKRRAATGRCFSKALCIITCGGAIMYPEINTPVDELHRRRISTFLVTNAQFPGKIRMLKPVTQESLKALNEEVQRTVYRLRLVKGWKPDSVEIKGVTYCGSTATSKLTMENVPWHSDVKDFSEALASKSEGQYEVACEHVHSCCVLPFGVTVVQILKSPAGETACAFAFVLACSPT
ncbi:S-adenosyl-L-methionine-dependent tRNA 4-demethylwyosine synthase-like protein [Drosera capensis]